MPDPGDKKAADPGSGSATLISLILFGVMIAVGVL
jgi:hypothetical protein